MVSSSSSFHTMWYIIFFIFSLHNGYKCEEVFVAADRGIYKLNTELKSMTLVVDAAVPVYSLDFHFSKGYLYYTSEGSVLRRNMKDLSEGALQIVSYQPKAFVNSVAVDWIHDFIFWTEGLQVQLFKSDLDGTHRKNMKGNEIMTIFNVTYLRTVVVDPFENLIFILADVTSSTKKRSVIKASLDGRNMVEVDVPKFSSAYSISIDFNRRKIFAARTENGPAAGYVTSCDYSGAEVSDTYVKRGTLLYPIHTSRHSIYFMSRARESFAATPTFNKREETLKTFDQTFEDNTFLLNNTYVYDIKAFNWDVQKSPSENIYDRCRLKNCEHRCISLPVAGPSCTCPPLGMVDYNGRKCIVDQGARLLITRPDNNTRLHVLQNNIIEMVNETLFDYHYFKDILFTYIPTLRKIYRRSLSTGGSMISVVETIGDVRCISVDWVHDTLYWVNMNNVFVVEVADFRAFNIRRVCDNLSTNITDLLVEPYEGYIFMVDDSDNIIRANLEGKDLIKVPKPGVTTIAIDHQKKVLYYSCYSVYYAPFIASTNYEFSKVIQLKSNGLWQVLRIAIFKDTIFTIQSLRGQLYKAKITARNEIIKDELVVRNDILKTHSFEVGQLKVVHASVQRAGVDQSCIELGCSHICEVGGVQGVKCSCPRPLRLSSKDGVSCKTVITLPTTTTMKPSDYQHSSSISLYHIVIALVAGVVILLVILCCLFMRYGLTIGNNRYEYKRNWWREERRRTEVVELPDRLKELSSPAPKNMYDMGQRYEIGS